jgi:hypothetical protein
MAPGVVYNRNYDFIADIYSLGIIVERFGHNGVKMKHFFNSN